MSPYVNDTICKFLQFQVLTNITTIITFIPTITLAEEKSILNTVQLLWINITMDTFTALALTTNPVSDRKLDTWNETFHGHIIKVIFGWLIYQPSSFSSSTSLAM